MNSGLKIHLPTQLAEPFKNFSDAMIAATGEQVQNAQVLTEESVASLLSEHKQDSEEHFNEAITRA